jgi:hypothetical protein
MNCLILSKFIYQHSLYLSIDPIITVQRKVKESWKNKNTARYVNILSAFSFVQILSAASFYCSLPLSLVSTETKISRGRKDKKNGDTSTI